VYELYVCWLGCILAAPTPAGWRSLWSLGEYMPHTCPHLLKGSSRLGLNIHSRAFGCAPSISGKQVDIGHRMLGCMSCLPSAGRLEEPRYRMTKGPRREEKYGPVRKTGAFSGLQVGPTRNGSVDSLPRSRG
jgi:hypothetical protein